MGARGPKGDKIWSDAVRRAVNRLRTRRKTGDLEAYRSLNMLADKLVSLALDGNTEALKEIGNRLDGRPAQAVEMSASIEHNYVARMPAVAKDADEWQKQHAPPTIQ